ncbi:glycine betaine ABC transporter substrate-binding protein [Salinisphaera orenii]|uniref:glycine betaine ABC transporter substrate-binding protein n=1 Tax=Salinisphaera orenii TaxID=856731 RepID=UPI000DBE00AD
MASKNDYEITKRGDTGITRRGLFRWSGAAVGSTLLAGSGIGRAIANTSKTLTIGNIGWVEDVALSHLTKVILEDHFGYQVNVVSKSVDDLFAGVADGSIDTFQDVWLPQTHKPYWQEYGDQIQRLAPWYQGRATLGLTVPDYVQAKSISDLTPYGEQFDHKIVGVEPGAGETRIIKNDVMPGYNLDDYTYEAGSTQHMLKKLDQAISEREPIVVALYRPHWAFNVYNLRYLNDPKNLISNLNDRLYTIVRKGLSSDTPEAYALLESINLSPSQLGQLELAIQSADGPTQGVRNWLAGDRAFGSNKSVNKQLVEPWINAARAAAKK